MQKQKAPKPTLGTLEVLGVTYEYAWVKHENPSKGYWAQSSYQVRPGIYTADNGYGPTPERAIERLRLNIEARAQP